MSASILSHFVPHNALPYLEKWFGQRVCHLRITKNRNSKLGDYRKLGDKTHQISVNGTLEPELFFFVLTHELAHLLVFEKYGHKVSPHGKEWKNTYREMLLDSLDVYAESLRPLIIKFSRAPKANFMAFPDLVRYFHHNPEEGCVFVEALPVGAFFEYRKEHYHIEAATKKRYLCKKISSGTKYYFKGLAQVKKIENNYGE